MSNPKQKKSFMHRKPGKKERKKSQKMKTANDSRNLTNSLIFIQWDEIGEKQLKDKVKDYENKLYASKRCRDGAIHLLFISLRFSNIHCDQIFLKPKYGQIEKATEEKQR